MNNIKAKHRILELYSQHSRESYEQLSKEDFKEIFYAIRKEIPYKKKDLNIAIKPFIFYGALKFDKFSIPTPYASTEDDFVMFKLLLNTLCVLEGPNSINTPFLMLHKIKWNVYNRYNFKIIEETDHLELKKLQTIVNSLLEPSCNQEKLNEFNAQKEKLNMLLDGLMSNTLSTKISTNLPYNFTSINTIISFKLDNINVEIEVIPKIFNSLDSFITVDPNLSIENEGATRWQNSFSKVNITINALIDDSRFTSPLMLEIKEDRDSPWNYLFDLTYEIIDKLWWHLKEKNIATSNWCPVPKDIPFISYSQWNSDKQVEFKMMSNPSYKFNIRSRELKTDQLKIGTLKDVKWLKKCYIYAQIYADIGQYNESLFWLNVSTESMIDCFINSVVTDQNLLKDLNEGVSVFDTAEEIISKQFPEMKGKIQWPKATKHPSIYTKIKRVIKKYDLTISEKEFNSKYNTIKSERNNLFHGNPTDIPASHLRKAFIAYQWMFSKLSPYFLIEEDFNK